MSAATPVRATARPADGSPAPRRSAAGSSSTWSWIDRLGLAFAWFLGLLFCAITAAIVIFLAVQGIRYLRPYMLWTNPKVSDTQAGSGGFLDPMLGTFMVAAIAIAIAGPVGIGVAVWLSEYAGRRGWPAPSSRRSRCSRALRRSRWRCSACCCSSHTSLGFLSTTSGGVVFGKSFFAAGAILSLVALPYVVSSVREGLQAIPNHVREASYAVGKTKIATIRRVLLPAARPSVITGYMLGIGHVIGDTAIIVLLLGDTQTFQGVGHVPMLGMLRGTGSTLTSYVFDNAPTGDLNQPNKAYAAAFVLLLIVLGAEPHRRRVRAPVQGSAMELSRPPRVRRLSPAAHRHGAAAAQRGADRRWQRQRPTRQGRRDERRRRGPRHSSAPGRPGRATVPTIDRMNVDQVSIAYGSKLAVKSVSLPIRQGEVLALIGPSGCGKTTLLRSLNRLDRVDQVGIADRSRSRSTGLDITTLEPTALRRRVTMVFQQPNPFPMSVFDNVAYVLRDQAKRRPRRESLRAGGRDAHWRARACSTRSPTTSITRRCACPEASSSVSASPARWPRSRRYCCSTSRARRSILARPP